MVTPWLLKSVGVGAVHLLLVRHDRWVANIRRDGKMRLRNRKIGRCVGGDIVESFTR